MIFRDRKLYLATHHKQLGGVCAGVANYLELPGAWIRVAAVIGLLIHPSATLLAYGLAFMVLEEEPEIMKDCDNSSDHSIT